MPSNAFGSWLTRPLEILAASLLGVLMALTCVDVAGRYLLNAPVDGATELTRLLMAGVIFAALPAVSRDQEHVSVDLLDGVFPRRLLRLRHVLINLVCGLCLAAVAWRAWLLAVRHGRYGDTTEFLQIPVAPVVYFISVMCALTAILLLLAGVLGRPKEQAF